MIVNPSRPSSSSIVSSSSSSTARASSTWNRDTRRFGPQNALDGTSDLSWNSGPSSENNNEMSSGDGRSNNAAPPSSSSSFAQYYEIHFHRSVQVREMRVQFQGGFVGLDCTVYKQQRRRDDDSNNDDDIGDDKWEVMEELYMDPMDTTDVQSFYPSDDMNSLPSNPMVTAIRIEFGKSTDFYGRIVLYSIEVRGMENISEE